MALNKEIVKLNDGKEIEVKEISFAGQLRLEKIALDKGKDKITSEDLYREILSDEDFQYLEQVGKEDRKKIMEAYNRVEGVNEKDSETTDDISSPIENGS